MDRFILPISFLAFATIAIVLAQQLLVIKREHDVESNARTGWDVWVATLILGIFAAIALSVSIRLACIYPTSQAPTNPHAPATPGATGATGMTGITAATGATGVTGATSKQ
ncbi:MAG TPA: hypothetical protein VNN08_20320 [Thermoanaerobaculia bacterium]|nr:hypothetical protein [Thermoanaerobaculia bacterium]